MLTLLAIAAAHHDAAVGQVGPRLDAVSGADARGTWSIGLTEQSMRFGRTLKGTERFGPQAGIGVHVVRLDVGHQLGERTRVAVGLPAGAVVSDGAHIGIGDPSLGVVYGRALRVHGTLTAPLGRYDRSPAASVVDVTASGDEVVLTTYDTRASLGAGAWTARLGGTGSVRAGRVELRGGLDTHAPLDRTPDGIRWGATVAALAGARLDLVEGLGVAVSVDARHHLADRYTLRIEGVRLDKRTGRRTELAAMPALEVESGALICSASARIPLWQHVQGIQLVESFGVQGGCTARIRPRRRTDPDEAGAGDGSVPEAEARANAEPSPP